MWELGHDLEKSRHFKLFNEAALQVINFYGKEQFGLKPVLCHADISPNNIRWDGKILTLIDWDNARADIPEADIGIMFFWSHFREEDSLKRRDLFLNCYGHKDDAFRERIRWQEIIQGLRLLPWYEKYDKIEWALKKTVDYLKVLIKF